jgi:hypothetical protein
MIVFDIRADSSHVGFIAVVNRGLDSEPANPYLARYGHVCSEQWWACFDRGELPVEILSGTVSHVGPRLQEWGEVEDLIEFVSDGQVIGYDRDGHWAAFPIRVGDHLEITRTIANLVTRTGPVQYQIDLRCEWIPSSPYR